MPALFFYLDSHFKALGKAGDKVVVDAIGFLYLPYRASKEWWMLAELVRVLLLTSTLGFISRSCWMKMLMGQIIALVFLCIFLYVRPCTFQVARFAVLVIVLINNFVC